MINYKRITVFMLTVIVIFGVIAATSPHIIKGVRLGLDLKGGFEVLYEAAPLEENGVVTKEALRQTANSLEKRINALGTTEPEILPEGDNRIRVRIAGVEDEKKVRDILKKPAELTFRGPDGTTQLNGSDFVEGAAEVGYDEIQRPIIHIEVKDKDKLRVVSEKLLHQPLAIYLDDTMLSDPIVQSVLGDGRATISGSYTFNEAKELADTINLGALPLKLTEKYSQSVGASLGQLSLEQTVKAAIIGSIIILLFMLTLYRVPGIVASITLIIYTWALLLVFYWIEATLTLPGIAAFVLGIGMAVDANIITYERLKDEIRSGKSLMSSLRAGSKNSLRTIMDANITTVIAAIVLFYIGTGAIKGFALTLMLSIALSIATNVFLAQWLLQMLIKGNINKPGYYGVPEERFATISDLQVKPVKIRKDIDFVSRSKPFFIFSIIVALIGTASILIQSLNFGVDFKAGTSLDISLGHPIEKSRAEQMIRDAGFEASTVTVGGLNQDQITIRFDRVLGTEQHGEVDQIVTAFKQEFGDQVTTEENTVDPGMAQELAYKALIAVAAASLGIMIYVSFRFEWRFALAAIIALLHDAFFVISTFSIFRLEVNLPFIAAILTIIGYSINDTIVIFDRIRENLRFSKAKTYKDLSFLVNQSINQTLSRSINTGITVFIAALVLLIWGSESIRLFSLAMTVGLVIGMYSSIFIASQVWLLLKKKTMKTKKVATASKRAEFNNSKLEV